MHSALTIGQGLADSEIAQSEHHFTWARRRMTWARQDRNNHNEIGLRRHVRIARRRMRAGRAWRAYERGAHVEL